MKHIRKIGGLALAAGLALSLSVPAFASDYSFTTTASQDYYKSTSYEEVYDSRYNYGGKNVTDFHVQETVYGCHSTTMTGVMERAILPGLQESVMTGGGGGYGLTADSAIITTAAGTTGTVTTAPISVAPVATPTVTYQQPAYTSVAGMAYQDGSIGTVKIPKLGISVKVWEGETSASMSKGVGHYASTSAWDGNACFCGHNRGARYNIGTIKNLKQGDIITYTTAYGTRTYQVTLVQIIANNDWSYLQGTADNRITLTTCLENHPESRVLVQAVEKK